jgi:NitT/TauT family transport system ATP-binding protein
VSDLVVRGLSKSFGGLEVLRRLSIRVPEHGILSVLGPSGCGKTTLLNVIAGTVRPDEGLVEGTGDGGVSYLFQEPRLLPWKTVSGNIEFVLQERMEAGERRKAVASVIALVGLEEFRASRPAELSGGMKQRAAMARAFAYPSSVLLMDEPFRALDLPLKLGLMRAFLDLWERDLRTVLFVTHDIQEALFLGDDILVLSPRPAVVRDHVPNPIPRAERSFQSPAMLALERELYELLLR